MVKSSLRTRGQSSIPRAPGAVAVVILQVRLVPTISSGAWCYLAPGLVAETEGLGLAAGMGNRTRACLTSLGLLWALSRFYTALFLAHKPMFFI